MVGLIGAILLAGLANSTSAAQSDLGSYVVVPAKGVTHIDSSRLDLPPGQQLGEHFRSVPTICFVSRGAVIYSIGSGPIRLAQTGETTFEPVGSVVHFIRNASTSEGAQLMCAGLAGPSETARIIAVEPPTRP